MTINEFAKDELSAKVAENVKSVNLTKKQAGEVIEKVLDGILELLAEGSENAEGCKLTLRNFGVFTTKIKESRQVRNFHTGELFMSTPKRAVTFKFSNYFKNLIKEVPVEATKKAKKKGKK